MAYLLTYFVAVAISSKLKNWINFGIYWKQFTFAFSALALARLLALVLHVSGLGLGLLALALTPLALLTSLLSSVCNVCAPYSRVEVFGNVFSPLCTLAIV